MAVSFVGQSQSGTASITLPSGILAGDLIIIFSHRNTTTAPSLATGFTDINSTTGNTNAARMQFKRAVGGESGTSVTVTNANSNQCAVYRGARGVGANSITNSAASTSNAVPAVTLSVVDNTSWVAAFSANRQTTSKGAITSLTQRGTSQAGTTSMIVMGDSNGGTTSGAAKTSSAGASATSAGGQVEIQEFVKTETLTDDFTSGTIDTLKWSNYGGAQVTQTSGKLQIVIPSAASAYYGLDSRKRYSLKDSYMFTNLSILSTTAATQEAEFQFVVSTGNRVWFVVSNNVLTAYKQVGSTSTANLSVTYNPTTHAWLQIRETSGTLYWETSPTGYTGSWSPFFSEATPLAVTDGAYSVDAGAYSTSHTGNTMYYDNVNIAPTPPATTSVVSNLMMMGAG